MLKCVTQAVVGEWAVVSLKIIQEKLKFVHKLWAGVRLKVK